MTVFSEDVRQLLAWAAIALILGLVLFFADREQPDSAPKDSDDPRILDEEDFE